MEIIFNAVQGLISYIVPMIILLGLLIFVHELGHFLVAKYFKVRVEVFSLGFGPKIFKYKRGDTVYAISAIPLGGYVKMFGDDPTADVASDQRAYSYTHKPVGQRIAIVLAGPLMNFFFAIVVFAAIAMIGEQAFAPKLGDIKETTPAYAAGFRSGDQVVSVANNPVVTWEEFQSQIERNAEQTVPVVVQRGDAKETLNITPKLVTNKNVLSWDRQVGEIDGLTFLARAPFIGIPDPTSPAGSAGLKTGDHIKSVNGVAVTKWREFVDEIKKAASSGSGTVALEVERGHLDEKTAANPEVVKAQLPLSAAAAELAKNQDATELLKTFGIEFPELYLASLEKNSPAAKAGLQTGDRLVSIDGQPVHNFEEVVGIIRSFGNRDSGAPSTGEPKPLDIVVSRNGQEQKVSIAPNLRERMSPQGKEERRFEIGIRPMIVEAQPSMVEVKSENTGAAIARGVSQTVRWTSLTVLSFVRLFQAEVSPKNIGGFLSIGQMAKKSWQIGPSQFLNIMGIISINLFILNLLPVPVLDGGHLVFFTIEAIKGAPLSMRKMEIAQQVGLVLLLGLMVFALFNDVTRLIFN